MRSKPWDKVAQSSTLVLLKGQLRTSGRASRHQGASKASRDWEDPEAREAAWQQHPPGDAQPSVQGHKYNIKALSLRCSELCRPWQGAENAAMQLLYRGPCVLPFLWQPVVAAGETMAVPQPISFQSGPEGVLDICTCCQAGLHHSISGRPSSWLLQAPSC